MVWWTHVTISEIDSDFNHFPLVKIDLIVLCHYSLVERGIIRDVYALHDGPYYVVNPFSDVINGRQVRHAFYLNTYIQDDIPHLLMSSWIPVRDYPLSTNLSTVTTAFYPQ